MHVIYVTTFAIWNRSIESVIRESAAMLTQLTYSNSLTRRCVGFSQLISFICFECSRNKHVLEFFVKLEGSVERTCRNSTSYVSSTKDYVVSNRHIALWIWDSDKLKATRNVLYFLLYEENTMRGECNGKL